MRRSTGASLGAFFLEEEPHAGARDGEFEVAVLLVAARVTGEGDPGVVGRVHRPPRVLGDVRERGLSSRALKLGREAAAQRLQLGTNAPADLLHPCLESLDVEDLEVGGSEGGRRHRDSPILGQAGRTESLV